MMFFYVAFFSPHASQMTITSNKVKVLSISFTAALPQFFNKKIKESYSFPEKKLHSQKKQLLLRFLYTQPLPDHNLKKGLP